MSERRKHAERYRSMNMEPLPLPAGKKGPGINDWQHGGHEDVAFNGEGNIGLILGEVGHGLVCVDLDCDEAIELAPKFLPDTPAVIGRAGRKRCHWFYRCDESGKKASFNDPQSGDVIVEVLASGQQVVVGPSTHPDGGDYDVLTAEPATVERMEIDEAVGRLHDAVLHARGHAQSEAVTEQQPPDVLTPTGTRPGDDYSDRGHDHFRSVLDRHGWKHMRTADDGNEHWERPGKDERSTSATLKDGVFYVFSSSVSQLQASTGYSMFAAYAAMQHGGEHSKAAKALATEGYGHRPEFNATQDTPFPVDALSPAWAEWITASAAAKNIPTEMLALPALAAAGAAISNMVLANPWDTWGVPSMLWTIVVAPTGTMKTSPFREANQGVYDQQRKLDAQHNADMERHNAESRAWKVHTKTWEKNGAEGEAPREPQSPCRQTLTLTDTTVEAVVQAASNSARGILLANDELAQWFEQQGAYKSGRGTGGDDAVWNASFNGEAYSVARKTTGTQWIDRLSVSVAGTIQPGILKFCSTRRNRESGLLVRFLPAIVQPPAPIYSGIRTPPSVVANYLHAFEKLYDVRSLADGNPAVLKFDEDAFMVYRPWHDKYANMAKAAGETEPLYAGALAKLRGYAVRIALVLTFTDWACRPSGMDNPQPTTIGADEVRRACQLVDWFHGQWRDLLDMLNVGDDDVDVDGLCLAWFARKGGVTTVRELTHEGPAPLRGQTQLVEEWLAQQVVRGVVERVPRQPGRTGGRPTDDYRLCIAKTAE